MKLRQTTADALQYSGLSSFSAHSGVLIFDVKTLVCLLIVVVVVVPKSNRCDTRLINIWSHCMIAN